MNQILCCERLPEQAGWRDLAGSGLPVVSRKKIAHFFLIINPLLTQLVWLRWLDIGLVLFFCMFMDLDFVSVHEHAKKELGQ